MILSGDSPWNITNTVNKRDIGQNAKYLCKKQL